MKTIRNTFTVIKPFLFYILFGLTLLFVCRNLLLLWQLDRIDSVSTYLTVLLNGFRIDLSTLAYLLIIPALIHPFILLSNHQRIWLISLKRWFLICTVFLLYFELATPMFINEYDLRPNRLFVEYLVYPKEVLSMLFNGHLLPIACAFIGLTLLSFLIWRLFLKKCVCHITLIKTNAGVSLLSFCLIVTILFMSARGTIGHRPLNPALVYFSTDPLVNSLTLNSAYSVAFAIKQLKNEKNAAKIYGNLSEEKVISIVRSATGLPPSAFKTQSIPTLAKRKASHQGKAKNLVIILEESLGAQFTGKLGTKALTPHIDKLMEEGWAFNRLYATGTRSVRGIEAVITGFTPTPARAVVKLDKSQQNFFTLASVLKRHNYHTQFVYGGESHFDNMKSFFLGNGFEDIVDFDDIQNPAFVGSWGASDEDLFNQANIELKKSHQSDQPFFSLIFTSSNHDPFEIPEGKVAFNENDDPRDRAIRYADLALGQFIAQAKKEAYWQDTVFLIVADHDARVFGGELVPIQSFHIPGVILGNNISEKLDNRLVSQIDLAPTLLSLIGVEDYTPMIGHDLTNDTINERVMMQFDKNFAYMTQDKVAILQPEKPIMYFDYDHKKKKLVSATKDNFLGEKALAHALFGSYAYNKGWYQLARD